MTLVHDDAQTAIHAFLQETRSKSESGAQREMMVLGEVPKGLYVYIGPVTPEAEAGDVLMRGDKSFLLRRTELVMVGEHPAYCWGICVKKGGDTAWGE